MGKPPKMPKMPEMPDVKPSASQVAQEQRADMERKQEAGATAERARRLGGMMTFQAPSGGATPTSESEMANKPPVKKPKR